MNYSTDFPSIKDQVSPTEWQARVDLAACYRLVDAYEMTDLIYNHITARIPGSDEHLLINLYGLLYKEITASSLVKIDVEGNIVWKPDTDYGINKSGYVIHGAIHKARPEVKCVLHTHTRAGMAVAAMKCGLLPLSQTSIRFVGHIGYHDYEGPAVDLEERERIVNDLGPHDALIMRNHGLLTCGETVQQAFNTMYQLEMSCRSQVDSMAARTELTMPGENVLAHTAHLYQPGTRRPYGVLEWPAMLRLLDAQQKTVGLSAVLALSCRPDSRLFAPLREQEGEDHDQADHHRTCVAGGFDRRGPCRRDRRPGPRGGKASQRRPASRSDRDAAPRDQCAGGQGAVSLADAPSSSPRRQRGSASTIRAPTACFR